MHLEIIFVDDKLPAKTAKVRPLKFTHIRVLHFIC